jgi:isopentenyl-diphosphate delta-isomerase
MKQEVILVNELDEEIGTMEKTEAHRKGVLHRAFSVFIFNSKGQMLLHQRAIDKYHSGGLWTNACCSHPRPGEDTLQAAKRRLMEEMGFSVSLSKIFDFVYETSFENGLTEHEFDHVFAGHYDGPIHINSEEVMDYCFKDIREVSQSLKIEPEKYTTWFRLAYPVIEKWWNET